MTLHSYSIFCFALAATISACHDQVRATLAGVSVWPDTVTLVQGDTLRFRVLYRTSNNSLRDGGAVIWRTTDSTIAIVRNGLVTAGRNGSATIVADSKGIRGFAHVSVVSGQFSTRGTHE